MNKGFKTATASLLLIVFAIFTYILLYSINEYNNLMKTTKAVLPIEKPQAYSLGDLPNESNSDVYENWPQEIPRPNMSKEECLETYGTLAVPVPDNFEEYEKYLDFGEEALIEDGYAESEPVELY